MSNPFDLPGPEFLKLYLLLFAMAAAAALIVRWLITRTTLPGDTPLDRYEIAYLAGGPQRVALLAVYSLVERGHARFSGRQVQLVARAGNGPDNLHRRLMATAPDAFSPRQVRRLIGTDIEQIRDGLQSQELIARPESVALSRAVTLLALGGVLAAGVTKIVVGISRNRPVGVLILLCALTVLALVLLVRGRYVTSAGNRLLQRQRARRPRPVATSTSSDDTAVAVWGLPALNHDPNYANYQSSFGSNSSGSDSSCSSSSSCSSGSSCGGSSCGGCSSS